MLIIIICVLTNSRVDPNHRWDEYIVIPDEAHRVRPLWASTALAVGSRQPPTTPDPRNPRTKVRKPALHSTNLVKPPIVARRWLFSMRTGLQGGLLAKSGNQREFPQTLICCLISFKWINSFLHSGVKTGQTSILVKFKGSKVDASPKSLISSSFFRERPLEGKAVHFIYTDKRVQVNESCCPAESWYGLTLVILSEQNESNKKNGNR